MPGLLVHDVLLRAEPAAAGDHPGARPGPARLPAADDAVVVPPDRRRRLPAVRRRPRPEPAGDPPPLAARRRRLRPLPPRPRPGRARRSSRCSTTRRRTSSARTPRTRSTSSGCSTTSAASSARSMHDVVRLLTGSAADWLDDYFEHEAVKGYHASSRIIGSKVGPMSPGSGLVLLFHKMGEHDGHLGSWAFHKGGNGGFTQVLARAAEAFGAEIRLESPVTVGAHRGRPRGRRRARGRHRVPRAGRRVGARPAAHLPRAGRPARAARRPGRQRASG